MKPNDNTQNLWKDNTEIPSNNSIIVFVDNSNRLRVGLIKYHTKVKFAFFENGHGEPLLIDEHFNRWCYEKELLQSHNDLQAQVDELKHLRDGWKQQCENELIKNKDLQSENNRYKKALEIAKGYIQLFEDVDANASLVLTEIETTLTKKEQ